MSGTRSRVPDPFALGPFIALLPKRGDLRRIEARVQSIYVRYENIESLRVEHKGDETERRYSVEATMLRNILDWLSVQPGGEG